MAPSRRALPTKVEAEPNNATFLFVLISFLLAACAATIFQSTVAATILLARVALPGHQLPTAWATRTCRALGVLFAMAAVPIAESAAIRGLEQSSPYQTCLRAIRSTARGLRGPWHRREIMSRQGSWALTPVSLADFCNALPTDERERAGCSRPPSNRIVRESLPFSAQTLGQYLRSERVGCTLPPDHALTVEEMRRKRHRYRGVTHAVRTTRPDAWEEVQHLYVCQHCTSIERGSNDYNPELEKFMTDRVMRQPVYCTHTGPLFANLERTNVRGFELGPPRSAVVWTCAFGHQFVSDVSSRAHYPTGCNRCSQSCAVRAYPRVPIHDQDCRPHHRCESHFDCDPVEHDEGHHSVQNYLPFDVRLWPCGHYVVEHPASDMQRCTVCWMAESAGLEYPTLKHTCASWYSGVVQSATAVELLLNNMDQRRRDVALMEAYERSDLAFEAERSGMIIPWIAVLNAAGNAGATRRPEKPAFPRLKDLGYNPLKSVYRRCGASRVRQPPPRKRAARAKDHGYNSHLSAYRAAQPIRVHTRPATKRPELWPTLPIHKDQKRVIEQLNRETGATWWTMNPDGNACALSLLFALNGYHLPSKEDINRVLRDHCTPQAYRKYLNMGAMGLDEDTVSDIARVFQFRPLVYNGAPSNPFSVALRHVGGSMKHCFSRTPCQTLAVYDCNRRFSQRRSSDCSSGRSRSSSPRSSSSKGKQNADNGTSYTSESSLSSDEIDIVAGFISRVYGPPDSIVSTSSSLLPPGSSTTHAVAVRTDRAANRHTRMKLDDQNYDLQDTFWTPPDYRGKRSRPTYARPPPARNPPATPALCVERLNTWLSALTTPLPPMGADEMFPLDLPENEVHHAWGRVRGQALRGGIPNVAAAYDELSLGVQTPHYDIYGFGGTWKLAGSDGKLFTIPGLSAARKMGWHVDSHEPPFVMLTRSPNETRVELTREHYDPSSDMPMLRWNKAYVGKQSVWVCEEMLSEVQTTVATTRARRTRAAVHDDVQRTFSRCTESSWIKRHPPTSLDRLESDLMVYTSNLVFEGARATAAQSQAAGGKETDRLYDSALGGGEHRSHGVSGAVSRWGRRKFRGFKQWWRGHELRLATKTTNHESQTYFIPRRTDPTKQYAGCSRMALGVCACFFPPYNIPKNSKVGVATRRRTERPLPCGHYSSPGARCQIDQGSDLNYCSRVGALEAPPCRVLGLRQA